jgi:hypothetical protein
MTGIHSGQDAERKFRTAGGTGPLASIAELIEALAHLLRLEQGRPDRPDAEWFSERLLSPRPIGNRSSRRLPSWGAQRSETTNCNLLEILGCWFIDFLCVL